MFFVSNEAAEASSQKGENKHLGGKIFKIYSFFIQYHMFLSKMGHVTAVMYIFIILMF